MCVCVCVCVLLSSPVLFDIDSCRLDYLCHEKYHEKSNY